MPYIGKRNALLIFDSYGAHYSHEVLNSLLSNAHKNLRVAVIPGGYTSRLQPLDISVNKSFKSSLREIMRRTINLKIESNLPWNKGVIKNNDY